MKNSVEPVRIIVMTYYSKRGKLKYSIVQQFEYVINSDMSRYVEV